MNTELRKQPKYDFEKDFFKLVLFLETKWKMLGNIAILNQQQQIELVSEPNYHTANVFLRVFFNRNEEHKSENE